MGDRPEDIEDRIHQTQDELRKDLEALDEKLSRDHLKAEARDRIEEAKGLVKESAVEGTRQAGEAVREGIDGFADGLRGRDAGGSSPSLLALAVAIGIGLLLLWDGRHERREESRQDRPRPAEPASPPMPPPMATRRPYVR